MKGSEDLGADQAPESKSNKDSLTSTGGAAVGGAVAVGGAAGGGLASKLGGAGVAIAGKAFAIPAGAVIGIGILVGGGGGFSGLGLWRSKRLSILDQRERHQWPETQTMSKGLGCFTLLVLKPDEGADGELFVRRE